MAREKSLVQHGKEKRSHCEIGHFFGGSSCEESAQVNIDGLLFCWQHASEVKLEGQILCWREMLFHIDLWAREANCRQRRDVVHLLGLQRVEATSAMERACMDLIRNEARSSETPRVNRKPLTMALLPAKGGRRLSEGLGCH